MKYTSIITKVKVMKGRLLKYDDYKMLIKIGDAEKVASTLLCHQGYKYIAESTQVNPSYNMALFQENLAISTSLEFNKVYKFIHHQNTKKYLDIFNLQYKIKMLKLIMCAVYDKRSIKLNENYHKLSIKLDIKKITLSKTLKEVIESLKNTEFYNVLNSIYKADTTIFNYNMRLDLYYYMQLLKLQNKYLDVNNKKIISNINGLEVDIQNIMLIYRLKKYYNIKPKSIYPYIAPYYHKISNTEIKNMVESKNVEDLYTAIFNTKYKKYFKQKNNIQKVYREIMGKAYKSATCLNGNTLVVVTNYFYLKELEVNNLISLLEGIRYKLSENEIMEHITIQ